MDVQLLHWELIQQLAQQIADELTNLAHFIKGMKIAVIYGGQPFGKQMNALSRKPQILVATPGRLLDQAFFRAYDGS